MAIKSFLRKTICHILLEILQSLTSFNLSMYYVVCITAFSMSENFQKGSFNRIPQTNRIFMFVPFFFRSSTLFLRIHLNKSIIKNCWLRHYVYFRARSTTLNSLSRRNRRDPIVATVLIVFIASHSLKFVINLCAQMLLDSIGKNAGKDLWYFSSPNWT